MNWKVFNLKYDNREQWAFEQMSYLLFCAEFDNRIGLFRYKNQTGIETEPIEKDGVHFGFQAKHYTTLISQNKDDIIDSIQKAKTKNNQLNVVYLYLNQELSESSKTDKKKSDYQIDIEKAAKKINVTIEWRVPSHFEIQLALPENKYIDDIFFKLDPNGGDLIDEVNKHSDSILRTIQTEIIFNDKQIKIDRSKIIEQIARFLDKTQNIIISGEGGCGKTAIFKEFYNQSFQKTPICIYKATELNVNHINDLFRLDHNFSFSQFLETYQSEPQKVFVIDSAEKLAELANNDILKSLIQTLKDNGWILIFTTRYSYLNDLSFHIKENYLLPCEVIDVPIISDDELEKFSADCNFALPDNQKFSERLKNLFYLNEYILYYSNIDKQGSIRSFIDLLWKKRIQNDIIKDNLHIERERCIINIAKERCETGRFYINADKLPQSALFQLKQDEILAYDDNHSGYYITHDIYEEWALRKTIEGSYNNFIDTKHFFDELGNSLPIRRAFRLWLSEQLSDNVSGIDNFIQEIFTDATASQFWKDELLVSVLLSDYSEGFFSKFDAEIKLNDFAILKRIIFLLRIACKEEDTFLSKLLNTDNFTYLFTKPKGKGWDSTIKHIYENREKLLPFLDIVTPLLEDWNNNTKRGNITRLSTLSTLYFYEHFEKSDSYYGGKKKQFIPIILEGALEIKEELKTILELVIQNKWKYHSNTHYDLCHTILTSNNVFAITYALPDKILELADLYWTDSDDKKSPFGHSGMGVEKYYAINENTGHDYFPASALQTPIYWLLEHSTINTINFILRFTNKAIERYAKSEVNDSVTLVDVIIDENTTIKQYLNQTIWGMYRGSGGITKPHVLESIHMALEKFLLKFAKEEKIDVVESYLLYLIQNSKSASITAIVTSVVLAYPEKFFNIALILFRTIEFFHIDGGRQQYESEAKSLYSIGYGMNKSKKIYEDERLNTCKDKHRESHLESLFFNFQFMGVAGFTKKQNTEFIKKLHDIIDQHKKYILTVESEKERNSLGILLVRMDRRNLTGKVTSQDDNNFIVEFTPINFPDDLRLQSEQTMKQIEETFKYSSLRTWADFISENRRQTSNTKYDRYNNDPLLALAETKQLVEELNAGRGVLGIFDYSTPAIVCSKLMIEYVESLSKEDKDYCREIILSSVSRLFSDDYDYQISDGVEASVHAIPTLMSEYPDDIENLKIVMILILFDEMPLGEYKRICDYAIESILESKLWEIQPKISQDILLGYIKLKPIYNNIYNEKRKEKGFWGAIPKSITLQELETKATDFSFTNISFDIQDIDSFDIHDLGIIYQLTPSKTKDEIHLNIIKRTLPKILPKLLTDRHSDKSEFDSSIYKIRLTIFKQYAYFLLEREIHEINILLQPLIDNFIATDEMSSLIEEIISAEYYINKYEQFWHIWNNLYPKFIEVCTNSNSYHLSEVIKSYLLAWQWWREGVVEWQSLKEENLVLYANLAKDLGHNPAVLYSITKILNSIGSKFTKEGVEWIYTIISINNSLEMGDLESITLHYLEKVMRKFIFMNKGQIKKEIRLKNKVIPILDFMIERGSIQGYLLRESIL
ncbi:MAG: AVAST type 4 anti-phage nuclease Avs4 [Paludibacter sp.]|nr:AVAST type 4 anti-phage nuclease Avs4 [Paludibacter sp.]